MKLLHEPLVHFLVLGALLFGVSELLGNWTIDKPGQIVVSPSQINALMTSFNIDFKHPPTPPEVDKLIQDWVREEIMVREAEKIQLQHDNQSVRLLLHNLMESANENKTTISVPTDQQLQEFLDRNANLFRKSPSDPTPQLDTVRQSVQSAYMANQRKAARDSAYEAAKKHYNIVIEMPKPSTTAPAGTTQSQ